MVERNLYPVAKSALRTADEADVRRAFTGRCSVQSTRTGHASTSHLTSSPLPPPPPPPPPLPPPPQCLRSDIVAITSHRTRNHFQLYGSMSASHSASHMYLERELQERQRRRRVLARHRPRKAKVFFQRLQYYSRRAVRSNLLCNDLNPVYSPPSILQTWTTRGPRLTCPAFDGHDDHWQHPPTAPRLHERACCPARGLLLWTPADDDAKKMHSCQTSILLPGRA